MSQYAITMVLYFYETSTHSESECRLYVSIVDTGVSTYVASALRVGFQEHNCRVNLSTDLHLTVKLHANTCSVHRLRLVSVYNYPAVKLGVGCGDKAPLIFKLRTGRM
jgi:hypothetical protein